MLDRCPGCGKEVKESDDICPHCKRDFSAPIPKKKAPETAPPPPKSEPRLDPPASLDESVDAAKTPLPRREPEFDRPASLDEPRLAPPASLDEEDDLTSLSSYEGSQRSGSEPITVVKPPPKASTAPYVIAAVLCGGALVYTQFMKKPAPAPAPPLAAAERPAEPAKTPEPPPAARPEKTGGTAEPVNAIPEDQPPPEEAPPVRKNGKRKTRGPRRPAKPREDAPVYVENSLYQGGGADIGAPSASAETPVPGATEFRVRGSVFELLTLKPVAEADVVFTNLSTGRRLSTETGPDGSFRASLPNSDQGYSLAIRHPKFEPSYIVDENRNFKSLSKGERETIANTRARTLADASSLNGVPGRVLKRDFALVPSMR